MHSLWKIMISNRNETSNFQSGLIKSLHLCAFHILKHSLSSLSISQVTYNVVPFICVSERSYKCRSFCLLFIIRIVMIPRVLFCRWRYHTTFAYTFHCHLPGFPASYAIICALNTTCDKLGWPNIEFWSHAHLMFPRRNIPLYPFLLKAIHVLENIIRNLGCPIVLIQRAIVLEQ